MVETIVYVLVCEIAFKEGLSCSQKVDGYSISFDVNSLRYFAGAKIRRSDFSSSLANFRLTWRNVAQTLRKIDQKFCNISKKTKPEIPPNSLSLLLHGTRKFVNDSLKRACRSNMKSLSCLFYVVSIGLFDKDS